MSKQADFFARKFNEIDVSLSEVQKQAVLQTEGALLLLASPGSGKTTTIIMRIGYLIEEKRVPPTRIKAVTFSRASAADMKERFKRFFPDLPPIDFSTIHSLAFEVVREHFRKTRMSYQLIEGNIDLEEQGKPRLEGMPLLHKKLILRDLYSKLHNEPITEDQMDELTTYISYIKNKMVPEESWPLVKCEVPKADRILWEYERFKRSGTDKLLVDYDDMLTLCNEIMERDRELLGKYQHRYDHVLTDESQDTSMVQHAIIEKLVREHGNLCVVADDDQSIYSWRGAEPSYLLNFKAAYPKAVTLFMEQNYRSSQDIVSVTNQFIKRNQNRYDKNMFTTNPSHKPIQIRSFADYQYQVKYLIEQVQEVENFRDVAILYRNNASSVILINEFERAGIPFYMKDHDLRFFSHWVVKDILNFMRMAFTDKRADIMEAIHTKISGYITKQQMSALKEINNNESVFDNLLNYVELQDYQRKLLMECKETLAQMKEMPPLHAIQVIRTRLGYEKAIEKLSERLGFRKDVVIGILNTLEGIATTLDTMTDFAQRLKHLELVMKQSKFQREHNVVTFSTLHSSKGLEFERVYMIDLIDGILPSTEDIEKQAKGDVALMEEAVRLFYVGMTRTKSKLELVTYKERDGEKVKESQFVSAIQHILNPPKPIPPQSKPVKQVKSQPNVPDNPNAIKRMADLGVGQFVKHRVIGYGEIISIEEDRVQIRFKTGIKVLSINMCMELGVLEPADGNHQSE
ncbi:DNA helicase-2 / ATP-dependent DNA helicase PcrA [Paenibacillus sp. 1_12]|uniref:ATP-dependent helicase n=1 Tax=Paenibacillus sp. 1_12 TaxID=1566278 RepID=UPI0008ED7819|nr:ATP-dependent helicase [Paenibacillus sp. 1_12]SFK83093.1 DNA helicase-2 / ATP-dependent DNA helicase PcrA [Paenibacillus sp. 1_12]